MPSPPPRFLHTDTNPQLLEYPHIHGVFELIRRQRLHGRRFQVHLHLEVPVGAIVLPRHLLIVPAHTSKRVVQMSAQASSVQIVGKGDAK